MTLSASVGLLFNLAVLAWAIEPDTYLQLGGMLLCGVVLCLLVVDSLMAIWWWRLHRLRSFVPLGACCASLILSVPAVKVGGSIGEWRFLSRLSEYEAVVSLMQADSIVVSRELQHLDLPARFSGLAWATLAERDSSGVLTVEFMTGGGFPVKHSGYLYRSKGSLEEWPHASRWPRARLVRDNWYAISD